MSLQQLAALVTLTVLWSATALADAKTPPPQEKIAATVNGAQIPESRIERYMASDRLPENIRARVRKRVLDKLIAEELLKQILVQQTEEPPKAETENRMKMVRAQVESGTRGTLENHLASQDMTMDDLQEQIAVSVRFERWANKLISKEQVAEYFEEHQEEFDLVRASHVLLAFKKEMSGEDKKQLRAKIDDIRKQAANGADFAQLAATHSDCPSKSRGGDLGLFARGMKVPRLELKAFTLRKGQVSNVLETQYGFHVILRTK